MQTVTIDRKLDTGAQEHKQLLFVVADLPLFRYVGKTDVFVEFGYCRLRTLTELEDLKEQYQQIYFSPRSNTKGKRAVFLQLKKLSYRISKFNFDNRAYG